MRDFNPTHVGSARIYEPRYSWGRAKDFETPRKETVKFDRIEVVSDEMRELIEAQWPDIAAKLPPKRSRAD